MTTTAWGEAIDSDDKLKLLINPESEYVEAAKNAFGRAIDDFIIDGALNPAFAGTDGQTSVAFPSGQILVDSALNNQTSIDAGTTDGGHMSPQRLRTIKKMFDANDVDPDEERFAAVGAAEIFQMLQWVPVISADYNTVKALAEGAVDTYMGFKFIMSNRLPTISTSPFGPFLRTTYNSSPWTGSGVTSGDRINIFWARSGLGHAIQEEVRTEIAKDPSLSFATRLYMEMVMGATRIEEARVVAGLTVEP